MIVFFFQAEDGIRDGHVTGVQTCALPISRGRFEAESTAACVAFDAEHQRRAKELESLERERRRAIAAVDRARRDVVILEDRKSTRLNSSHVASSYAVFCWKKKRQV